MGIRKIGERRRFVLLAMLLTMTGASVLFPGELRADEEADTAKWAGTWDVVADGKDKFTLTLYQTRGTLNGPYTPGNGQVRARLYEGVLNVSWRQDGSTAGVRVGGSARLTLSADGKSFTGTSKADGEDKERSWTGTLQPGSSIVYLAGAWNGVLNNNNTPLSLTLIQNGDTVTGSGQATFFEPNPVIERFTITEGKVKDRTLTFKVLPANGKYIKYNGIEKLVLLENGKTLQGTLGGIAAVAGYTGSAQRPSRPTLSNFTGTWNVMMDARVAWEFDIKQNSTSGDISRVTGTFYRVDDKGTKYNLKDAYVRDKTLTFDTTLNSKYLNKVGKVVMDEGGNTFKGTYAGSAMHGVKQGRYP